MSVLTYNVYTADVEYDAQEGILYGHVLDLRDTITFQSESAVAIVDEFHTSVDEYLSFCTEQGIEPAKPYSGTLYIRTSPDVHREATIAAAKEGKSLNAWLAEVVAQAAHHAVQTVEGTSTNG